jgi:hypothetical protein
MLLSVQAASLLGVGLLYQGSCHRLMTETVLEEMCRTPGINPNAAAAAATGGGQDGAGAAGMVRLLSACSLQPYAPNQLALQLGLVFLSL